MDRIIAACLLLAAASSPAVGADDERLHDFETNVRPVLVEKCASCHGAKKQESGLRVDSRTALLEGGDTGPALVPGDADASLLIQAVRRDGDVQMPPDEVLTPSEVDALTRWIENGAFWPDEAIPDGDSVANRAADHWAFQPLHDPPVPATASQDHVTNPIDAFVVHRLAAAGLARSPEADRRTLIRRVTYTLTGLPPNPEDTQRYVNDPDSLAYEHLVDRLLDSPHYGEHWARHWLDVARYADTKGYVYAREERFWIHAWAYRDWVVRALNEDMPYDRFLLLQIAADQVTDRNEADLAAMGFLTLGRRFLGVERDIVDDRIDTVCRATMGLTVGCARCHDHKYDPIPTADYYSLYGVFDSSREDVVPLGPTLADDEYVKELNARQEKLEATLAERRAESSARARARIGDYLKAQTELEKFPAQGFDQIFQADDLLPAFVRRWEKFLRDAARENDPVWVPWHEFAAISPDEFSALAPGVSQQFRDASPDTVNALVAARFAEPPSSFKDVIDRYTELLLEIEARWQEAVAASEGMDPPTGFDDPAAEELRLVLYGPTAPCEVPDEPVVHTEAYFPTSHCEELWKLQGEVDRWIINSSIDVPYAVTLVDRAQPSEPHIMLRGNPLKKGDEVPRQFLSVVAGADRKPFEHGSGRRELADAIIDPQNPLTARVIVNRVWAHHFGEGLVLTPSDFGTRADPPSHPELLDWLTVRFMESGWSLKKLHRLILTSATYRQSSIGPDDATARATALGRDPANRLLWRMNGHRLSFEEFRDSLLMTAGRLDLQIGGKPADMFASPYPVRRTLYGRVDRQFLPSTLRMFDFANPDLHTPERPETTVPQQALFLMNHPFVLEQARTLAAAMETHPPLEDRVRLLFERTLQRTPTNQEIADALALVQSARDSRQSPATPATAEDWAYGYGALNEESMRVEGFTPLPHFTGTAWQGGASYPDAELGWVQLTATGGHPGNDRQHACVRRWTAPRAMTVEIQSKLDHEAAPGDGIRAFIVSSRAGQLAAASVHQHVEELQVSALAVEVGDTIDFLVDIGDVLNNDQYLWSASITEFGAGEDAVTWNSQTDFMHETVPPMSGWEQLAQVLICSNEFLFID